MRDYLPTPHRICLLIDAEPIPLIIRVLRLFLRIKYR